MSVFTGLLLWLPTYFIDWALKDFECHKTSKSFWKKEFVFFNQKTNNWNLKLNPNLQGTVNRGLNTMFVTNELMVLIM